MVRFNRMFISATIIALTLFTLIACLAPAGTNAAISQTAHPSKVFMPIAITPPLFGVLQPDTQRQTTALQAGLRARTLEIGWNLYEPREGTWNTAYMEQQKKLAAQMRAAGFSVILDLGVQNPPDWVVALPNSRFVNQYGDTFQAGLGINGVNAIFNGAVRDHIARYTQRVFADLGTNFYAVRIGMGTYNELMYPDTNYNGHANSYWAFDPIAQGQVSGLPFGVKSAPNPGWLPGTPSVDHQAAADFANWYIDSLHNFHDWQVSMLRPVYPGKLMMLYPSWGLRPAQLQTAIAGDLNGTTSPEVNGEVQRGLDFARFVGGIGDPNVVLYTTWLDAPDRGDSGTNQAEWSPARYLAALAAANPLSLGVWGENSGHNSYADMQRCIRQAYANKFQGVLWAFERDLYSDTYATLGEYKALINGTP